MPGKRNPGRLIARVSLAVAACLTLGADSVGAYSRETFPQARPTDRDQAIGLLHPETARGPICLTSRIQSLGRTPFGEAPAVRRALELLQDRATLSREQITPGPGGIAVRYTTASDAFDRLDPTDRDADGRSDVLQATLEGIDLARQVLVDYLGLTAPAGVEVLMVRLDDRINGYVVPAVDRTNRTLVVLDASPTRGAAAARRAAIHHYAHAVAPALPSVWGEALASWSELASGKRIGVPLARMSKRLTTLSKGLLSDDPADGPGNAIWLAFVDEAYGPAAVRSTVEELSSGTSVETALGRALRRGGIDGLAPAFREFHLWSVLTAERSDEHHFSFAGRLESASFASSVEGLPALSVQADPPVAPLGAVQIRLDPMSARGGMRLHFEGEFAASWQTDLLLFDERGTVRRLALDLVDGRGEVTVPVGGVNEALLLVRNMSSDDGEPRRYSYSAQNEKDFPFVIAAATATQTDAKHPGVMVAWETESEQQLLAFNILRARAADPLAAAAAGPSTRLKVNPVWIPALGDASNATGYRFLDRDVQPGVAYVYRIEGITRDGLTALSDPFVLTPANAVE